MRIRKLLSKPALADRSPTAINSEDSPQLVNKEKRTNKRTACGNCRKRRRRCIGGMPCDSCIGDNRECFYERDCDRRMQSIKVHERKELAIFRTALEGVRTAIKNNCDEELRGLILGDASLEELAELSHREPAAHSTSIATFRDPVRFGQSETPTPVNHDGTCALVEQDQALFFESTHGMEHLLRSVPARLPEKRKQPACNMHQTGDFALPDSIIGTFERHMMQPLHLYDDLDLDMINFCKSSQHLILQGIPNVDTLEGSSVVCNALFEGPQHPSHTGVAAWAISILHRIDHLDASLKLAWFVLLVRYMKWCVTCLERDFNQLPLVMRPTTLQLSVCHRPQIDLIPIPALRDALIQGQCRDQWILPWCGNSISWKAPMTYELEQTSGTGEMTVTAAFEECICDSDSYSVDYSLLQDLLDTEDNAAFVSQTTSSPIGTVIPPQGHHF